MLDFRPLYLADRLTTVNPVGDVGVVTLWTPVEAALRQIERLAPGALDPATSRVAVVANLYGDGMVAMFCNLLHNPQIRHVVAVGQDLGLGTTREVAALLEHGVEEAEVLGRTVLRVPGTSRLLTPVDGFDVDRLREQVTLHDLGTFSGPGAAGLGDLLAGLPPAPGPPRERLRVEIPPALPDDYRYLPSEVTAHQVVRRGPLECWTELVVRTTRFGHPVTLADGPRLELLNARVVVTEPVDDPPEALERYGFSLERFHAYQRAMLEAALPPDISYTYGHRLRGYFPQGDDGADTLSTVIERLRRDPESRRAYVSLWDSEYDLPLNGARSGVPCLVTLFFRRSAGRLTLTATYRSHNLLTAWLQNVYGLMGVQAYVAKRVGMPVGPLSVVSHSLGLDPRHQRYDLARSMSAAWTRDEDVDAATGRHTLREDPHGYFVVTVDEEAGEIVAEHRYDGLLVKQYRADRAAAIEREVIGDLAVSLPSHAMWLGRELMTKEQVLRARTGGRRAGRSRAAGGGPG
ncbi:thymidylate synthase [Phycicoccus flavus]|uniref:Thymidylate synthase n=1 Tax=Phycicoccus flavus TaxID=2502783 RepID=A0A8T6R706_9MICO|nr:thymidylate synthase [Phycicoccus flavus]NHA69343.1 hypothetical protein [Phycicoccus flavus]